VVFGWLAHRELVERGSVVGLKALGWVLLANIVAPLIGVGAFILLHSF
jgi:hypothetical protein